MTVKKGDVVFVRTPNFPEARPAVVVGIGADDDSVDVFVLGTPHYHVDTGLQERGDGDDYGFLLPDADEPKSAAQVAKEQADADAQKELSSGGKAESDSEGHGIGLVSESEEADESEDPSGEEGEEEDADETESEGVTKSAKRVRRKR